MSSDRTERAKVFIYGQIGEVLNELDQDRILAIIQDNPNNHLFQISLDEILDLLDQIEKLKPLLEAVPEKDRGKVHIGGLNEFLEAFKGHCKKARLFRELAKFTRDDMDELSQGSLLLGETEETGFMEVSDYDEDE